MTVTKTKPPHTPTVKLPLQADMNIHHSPGLMSNGLNWICYILDNDDKIIARINGSDKEETRATQKLVVNAVNSHETMKEALEDVVDHVQAWLDGIERNGTSWDDWDEYYKHFAYRKGLDKARAAIALAEGN